MVLRASIRSIITTGVRGVVRAVGSSFRPNLAALPLVPALTGIAQEFNSESTYAGGTTYRWDEVPANVYSSRKIDGSPGCIKYEGLGVYEPNGVARSSFGDISNHWITSEFEFDLTSDSFEAWQWLSQFANWAICVDGLWSGNLKAYTGDGYHKITFADGVKKRRIRVRIPQFSTIGFRFPAGATVSQPPRRNANKVLVVGDSYTQGLGVTLGPELMGYAQRLREYFGWEVFEEWQAGTGYLNDPPEVANNKIAYDRLVIDLPVINPGLVIFAMGINDGAFSDAAVAAEADRCFGYIQDNYPTSEIVVLSSWGAGNAPGEASYISRSAAIHAKAVARGIPFISMLGLSYPVYDGLHPTLEGHKIIADFLATELYTLGYRKLNSPAIPAGYTALKQPDGTPILQPDGSPIYTPTL